MFAHSMMRASASTVLLTFTGVRRGTVLPFLSRVSLRFWRR